jgi:alkylation response protein AidB-like acyl-CoA dehydrogenase
MSSPSGSSGCRDDDPREEDRDVRFAPSSEQREFAAAIGELLAASDVAAAVRAWAAGDHSPGRKLWMRLAETGLLSLGAPDSGATAVDLVLGFEQLGRFAVPGPYVETVAVLPALGVAPTDAVTTVALPPHVPYALDAAACDDAYVVVDGVLHGAVLGARLHSVDAARLLSEVTPGDPVRSVDVTAAFDRGVLATAAQLHGLGRALLDRSVGYARQRTQFGAAIGSFQAVKHQLADVHVALELSRPLLFGAALSLSARDVSAAKVACTDAAYRAARVALQVHGAIGYTAEYDLAIELTKVRALVSAWGTQAHHRRRVWEAVQ